jgi:hypothetical protein
MRIIGLMRITVEIWRGIEGELKREREKGKGKRIKILKTPPYRGRGHIRSMPSVK